jgi:hypothetical protein
LLNVTAVETTTGPAKVMALVPDTVCVLVEKVYVPVPVAVMVPLLIKPFWKVNDGLFVVEKVPVLVKAPVSVFVPVALASLKVPLLAIVPDAVKLPAPSVKAPLIVVLGNVNANVLFANVIVAGIVNVFATVVIPPKVLVTVLPPKTKVL